MQTQSVDLAHLLAPWLDLSHSPYGTRKVGELHLDSRQIKVNDTFVAIQGHQVDGRTFIAKAIELGATTVLSQASEQHPHGEVQEQGEAIVIHLDNLHLSLSQLAGRKYSHSDTQLIGITGTNGKTTISQLIAQWLTLVEKRAAVMGTTGNGFLESLQPTANTTGSAIEIQRTLADLQQQGAQYTALEVSSHGLIQGRVAALQFEVGVFTNLSRDHLDYHGTMDEYAAAKKLLFTEHACKAAVINVDDAVGLQWWRSIENDVVPVSLGQYQDPQGVYATQVRYATSGIGIDFAGVAGCGTLNVPLIGEFNASNVLLAFATLIKLGIPKQALLATSEQLKPVLGRMELFTQPSKAKIVVDYAHTPDALEKALSALRVHCEGQLWVVVGCGGDRDTGKRPIMAASAEKLADRVIFSDDNPRSESPQAIIADMVQGLKHADKVIIEHDRFAAARHAVEQASEHDIILLAGKGHEDYQVFAQGSVHYSDRETAARLLGATL
ncbi:UDP-N-acetylmuramoyl-L-alanyl-D-glutamate--2,6-diaminopimelate ligase [Vibrio agarivorans]|uniref:UDP-N-acetylmuramoyl-L-alanyl-D-glutamate--2,6-diaminopimelate ligase n=1 Tax=Vibrio agarivorans TaxID=153622 RepID=A0ABT7Y1U2_9VIBR|nr:UDP-N-acetylmuramoyl-L-alanyl-D-glutamate--2,6-diaminopimelate ligase [Vibrio agarivorans]MDN2482001.1 UDP-N-acetylmuramoyl-L-alanyl-D-glutamate--2,6-diaminopimelate ligase [Vibrio agarivorans]